MQPTITLKEFFEVQLRDIKESVRTAYAAMEKRLEGMNEFRDQLKDQTTRFLTREEYEAKHEVIQGKIESLQKITYIGIGISLTLEFVLKFFFTTK